jgi:hypothetical protein
MAVSRRTIAAPIDAVAAVLADPRAYDGLVVGSRRIRWFDPRWPEVGTRIHHTAGFGPITIRDHTEVLVDELPARLELAAGIRPIGGLRVAFTLTAEAGPDGPATLVEVVEHPLSGPAAVAWPPPADALTAKRNDVMLQRLDDLARVRHHVRTLDDSRPVASAGQVGADGADTTSPARTG